MNHVRDENLDTSLLLLDIITFHQLKSRPPKSPQ